MLRHRPARPVTPGGPHLRVGASLWPVSATCVPASVFFHGREAVVDDDASDRRLLLPLLIGSRDWCRAGSGRDLLQGFPDALVDLGGQMPGPRRGLRDSLGLPQGVEDGDEGTTGDINFDAAVGLLGDVCREPEMLAAAGLLDEERPRVTMADDFGVGDASCQAEEFVKVAGVFVCDFGGGGYCFASLAGLFEGCGAGFSGFPARDLHLGAGLLGFLPGDCEVGLDAFDGLP